LHMDDIDRQIQLLQILRPRAGDSGPSAPGE
jgi:hypothetical protein